MKPANPRVLFRFVFFTALWLTLDGAKPAGLIVGLPAAALAAWLSVRLLPPGGRRIRPGAALALAWHFIRSSIAAGVDVAWRAFHPRMPLRPGLVEAACTLPHGTRRDMHLALGSLLPGSLPVGDIEDGRVVLHCLDTRQPVDAQMARQEKLLRRALGEIAS